MLRGTCLHIEADFTQNIEFSKSKACKIAKSKLLLKFTLKMNFFQSKFSVEP